MATIWKETYRPQHEGSPTPHWVWTTKMPWFSEPPRLPSSLTPREAWFVKVCSFTFEFQTIGQLEACLDYYRQKIHSSSRMTWEQQRDFGGDQSECQRWFERLPMYLLEEPKRKKVVAALERAHREWQQDRSSR